MYENASSLLCGVAEDRRNSPRVLVVDDNRDAAEMLSTILEAESIEARVAYTGAHALDLAWTWSPDVILLDLAMPGLDGFDVVRRIRSEELFDHVGVIAVSGRSYSPEQARDAGFIDFIRKPGSRDMIISAIYKHWHDRH